MVTLYLVRHGQTDWNTEGRLQGHADRPLNTVGRRQADAIAQRLARVHIDAIYASDLERTMTTAREIAAPHDLPVVSEPRLREHSYGVWEGRRMSDLARLYPEAMETWRDGPLSYVPPGGETNEDVRGRIGGLLDELRNRPSSHALVLVSHGRALRTLVDLVVPECRDCRPRPIVGTASLSQLSLLPEGADILLYGDTTHLVGIDSPVPVSGGS